MGTSYRQRIYDHYVESRIDGVAPRTIDGLKLRAPYIRKLIGRHFPADRRAAILDLGCGHGAMLYFAREAGYGNVRGVDGSAEQVAAARRLGIDGVEAGDVMTTLNRTKDASQDCILMFDVIEHFNKDELIILIDEVRRVLVPGGRWVIHAPNAESPFGARILFGDFTHELAFTRVSIAQILYSSGFSQVSSYEDEPVPHGAKSAVRWLLWKMLRSILRFCLAVETGDLGRGAVFSQNLLTVAIK